MILLSALFFPLAADAMSRAAKIQPALDWYHANSGYSQCSAQDTPIGWGLVATADVQPGDVLCTTPRALVIAAADSPQYLVQTRDLPDAPALSETAAVVARLAEVFADAAWAP